MTLNLGETIRSLRKRDGRTQEALAEALGITCQAVSRWEMGLAYPDVELIPAIANYFGISIDRLFGYEGDRERKVRALVARVEAYGLKVKNDGAWFDECIALLREGLAEFPNHPLLTITLAETLSEAGWRRHGEWLDYDDEGYLQHAYDKGGTNSYWKESVKLCETLLQERGTESEIAYRATELLVLLYRNMGQGEKGVTAAKRMPSLDQSRELLLAAAEDGKAEAGYIGEALLKLVSAFTEQLVYALVNCRGYFDTDYPMEKLKAALGLYDLLCDDGNYREYNGKRCELYLYLSRVQWERGQKDEAFGSLEAAYDCAAALEALCDGEAHGFTAPLLRYVRAEEFPDRGLLSRRVADLPEDWPVWCNPDYGKVAEEIRRDPRWTAWVEKCRSFSQKSI